MSSNNHDGKDLRKLFQEIQKQGINVEFKRNLIFLKAPNQEMYICHSGKKAFHPIRRWVNKQLSLELV